MERKKELVGESKEKTNGWLRKKEGDGIGSGNDSTYETGVW
jgi:hypothetical protein